MLLFGAVLLTVFYFFIYTIFGQAFLSLFRVKTKSLVFTTLIGFFVYYAVFQIFALPLKIKLARLSTLSVLWIVAVVSITLITLVFSRKDLILKLKDFKNNIVNNKLAIFFIIAIIVVQLLIIESNWAPGSPWDASFYIGEITSSIETNTIEQYDAYKGSILYQLNPSYLIENYEMHSAVICQITGMHPLIEVKTVMTAVIILLFNGIVFKTVNVLFKDSYYKTAIAMLFIMVINLCNVSVYSGSSFYFNRTYEGKTILACIILSMVFCLLVTFVMGEKQKEIWPSLFIVNFAAFCLNASAVFVLSTALFVFFVPALIYKRKLSNLIGFVLSLSPCILMVIVTYILRLGLLTITI